MEIPREAKRSGIDPLHSYYLIVKRDNKFALCFAYNLREYRRLDTEEEAHKLGEIIYMKHLTDCPKYPKPVSERERSFSPKPEEKKDMINVVYSFKDEITGKDVCVKKEYSMRETADKGIEIFKNFMQHVGHGELIEYHTDILGRPIPGEKSKKIEI